MSQSETRRRGGSRKGIPNKATANAREAIGAFVDQQTPRLNSLLEQIEEAEGPKAAWTCIMDLIEYHVPKLARTELTGKDGGPVSTVVKHVYEPEAQK